MRKTLYCLLAMAVAFSFTMVSYSYARQTKQKPKNDSSYSYVNVDWEYKGVTVSSYDPDVRCYKWETSRPPYGPWDKIALNRYVRQPQVVADAPYRPSPDKRKVLFINPGTWDRGYQSDMNPNVSQNWFFAENGYDVYTISFRTEYVPNLALDQFTDPDFELGDELAATADWTYGMFREDIKACVELAKKISRANKLFMGGVSRGGTHMFIYAAKYAKDLKGLVSFDGGGAYVKVDPANQMSLSDFQADVDELGTDAEPYLSEVSMYNLAQFAGAVPYAPAELGEPLSTLTLGPIPDSAPDDKKEIKYVSDLVCNYDYYLWGKGKVANYYEPYPGGNGETFIDRSVLVEVQALLTRYWPEVQTLESGFMSNYLVNPNLDYQNPDIDLPVIFFASEFSCPGGICQNLPDTYQPRTKSKDIETVYLKGYGHLDVFSGTHSLQDVKQPALQWMNERLR